MQQVDRMIVVGLGGRGGQYIRIVPELDLVVAVTAGYYQDYSPQAFQVQFSVFSDVLRAISPAGRIASPAAHLACRKVGYASRV